MQTSDARGGTATPEGVERAASAGRSSRWFRRFPATSVRVSLAYALFASLWIGLSDLVVERLVRDDAARARAQTVKGVAFILVTAVLLHVLIRRGERALRSVGSEMRATVDSMTDAVLVVDDRVRIVEANRAALELFAVGSKEELLGPLSAWADRFEVRTADGARVPHDRLASVRALAGERVMPYEAILRRADGGEVFVSITASPVYGKGRPPLAVSVLRDVSAPHRLDELRDEFLSTAAHEFKTPLAVVKAYAQLLRKRDRADDQALSVILRQVERLSRLVEHLLDASRIRSGVRDLRERFDLGDLAAEVLERMRGTAPRHTLTLRSDGVAEVDADRERIERVMTSLVDNAIRFSPAGGEVAVAVARSGGEVVFSVEDQGLGIPRERQARVFERYYRAHAGTADDYGGLGIGLDMSRETVERLGGRMWFESAPGKGSRFHFSLPLAPSASVEVRA